ncbi:hypothetical protein ABZ297_04680 [Nonomuraea sp. NPDC005983]|uniref:hypothetical protein n=1 Tax=Nonomuraea sp. NPDC005983 TaxID=3155595 RepID=UPI0033A851F7
MTFASSGLEIACDESGSEGEKLIGGNTDVFAHASVRLEIESAADCIEETRNRAPSPTIEYKSDVIRRKKHREALKWLLGPSSPLHGNAHVYLIDKAFLVVAKVVELLAAETSGPRQAVTLYREGPSAFGRDRWHDFLESFNDVLRAKNGRGPVASVDSAFELVDSLRLAPGPTGEIMEQLWQARPRVDAFRARLLDDPAVMPPLDPLLPAIVQAVVHWGAGGEPVSIVHDRQTMLTEERVTQLKGIFAASPTGGLTGLRLVVSRTDPRVQVADLLVGAARQIAEDELNGQGDAELTALLRPYVDAFSIWGDERSWALLGPAS